MILLNEQPDGQNVREFQTKYPIMKGETQLSETSDLSRFPFAAALFDLHFIDKITFGEKYIGLSKKEGYEWEKTEAELKTILDDLLLEFPQVVVPKKREQYTLYIEMTQNPNVMKFVANRRLIDGTTEIKRTDIATSYPLATAIFDNLKFVEKINLDNNYLFLTRNRKALWGEVMHATRDFISHYLQDGKPIIQSNSLTLERIEKVLRDEFKEEKISVLSYDKETKHVQVRLQGFDDCISCHASVRSGIEATLKDKLPNIIEVVEALYE